MTAELDTLINAMAKADRQRTDRSIVENKPTQGVTPSITAIVSTLRPPKGARVKFTPSVSDLNPEK